MTYQRRRDTRWTRRNAKSGPADTKDGRLEVIPNRNAGRWPIRDVDTRELRGDPAGYKTMSAARGDVDRLLP